MITKTCQSCKVPFDVYPSRAESAKYCGVACKREGQKTGTIQNCETCGISFYAALSRAKFYNVRFCSNKCKDLANRNRVDRVCEWCGVGFYVPAYKIKSGRGRFCSVGCTNSWRAQNDPRGQRNPFFTQVKHACKICGVEFLVKHHRKDARFCSNKCRGAWHSGVITGKNNGRWRGGKSFEPYPVEFNEPFKRLVRKRDNHTCAICRLPGNCVHHIDYDKQNTVKDNCIVVCRSCHAVTGANRQYWQVVLSQAVVARGF